MINHSDNVQRFYITICHVCRHPLKQDKYGVWYHLGVHYSLATCIHCGNVSAIMGELRYCPCCGASGQWFEYHKATPEFIDLLL